MKVAIVGTGWGRGPVGTFRRLGHEIVTIVGQDPERTRIVAAEEGIPEAAVDPERALAADFVVIASPTPSHLDLLRRLRGRPVLCEKPLAAGADPTAVKGGGLWVAYAFGVLDVAAAWARAYRTGFFGTGDATGGPGGGARGRLPDRGDRIFGAARAARRAFEASVLGA